MDSSPRKPAFPIVLVVLGLVLVAGGAFLFFSSRGGGDEIPARSGAQEDPFAGIPRVTIEEAKAAYDTRAAVFVDVRDADAFAQSHVPGALSIPLEELDQRTGELSPQAWIITYCT